MRTAKTAVAVTLSYLLFLPFQLWMPQIYRLIAGANGPFYACIASVICMQNSVGQSVRQGAARLVGTAVGGLLGLLLLVTDTWLSNTWFFALALAGGTVAVIWLCVLIGQPAACSIGVVVLCAILFNHTGPDRYLYALTRMLETAAGVLIAVAVNRALPDHREPPDRQEK